MNRSMYFESLPEQTQRSLLKVMEDICRLEDDGRIMHDNFLGVLGSGWEKIHYLTGRPWKPVFTIIDVLIEFSLFSINPSSLEKGGRDLRNWLIVNREFVKAYAHIK